MKRKHDSPEVYRESVQGKLREMLETVREIVLATSGDVEEGIKHGMLDYPGLANLAAQKSYVALYVKPAVLDRFRDRLPDCGKSCIRFRRPDQIDPELLSDILTAVWEARRP